MRVGHIFDKMHRILDALRLDDMQKLGHFVVVHFGLEFEHQPSRFFFLYQVVRRNNFGARNLLVLFNRFSSNSFRLCFSSTTRKFRSRRATCSRKKASSSSGVWNWGKLLSGASILQLLTTGFIYPIFDSFCDNFLRIVLYIECFFFQQFSLVHFTDSAR